ncbi:hypothetical protein AMJ80_07035 [bacterium SM23_31]|nr:MAG: hypothetical protein AMJ80_07035 [bacterium SM23_31]
METVFLIKNRKKKCGNLMDIKRIQKALKRQRLDGWLLYDFQGMNIIAVRLLKLPEHVKNTRRYFYFIPAEGTPRKLVHRIEAGNLDSLPGEKTTYLSWQSLGEGIKNITEGANTIAMEFSQHNAIPYVARVDAGTVDLLRFIGKDVVSSANLIQEFEATLTNEQIESHLTAAKQIRQFIFNAFDEIHARLVKCGEVKEYAIQHFLLRRLEEHNLITHNPPIVAVNANAGNPHYRPYKNSSDTIRKDNLVLIDLVAKLPMPKSVFADITWMAYTGEHIPDEYVKTFSIASQARDTAFKLVSDRFADGKPIEGWEVDDAARAVIRNAGYGEFFIHRTGHSIGEDIHGNGANMDNLETHDDRRILPRTCFSIEPGIYTDTYGIRTEIDVLITPEREAQCTGGDPQKEIVTI